MRSPVISAIHLTPFAPAQIQRYLPFLVSSVGALKVAANPARLALHILPVLESMTNDASGSGSDAPSVVSTRLSTVQLPLGERESENIDVEPELREANSRIRRRGSARDSNFSIMSNYGDRRNNLRRFLRWSMSGSEYYQLRVYGGMTVSVYSLRPDSAG